MMAEAIGLIEKTEKTKLKKEKKYTLPHSTTYSFVL
jgi:hypothetical protein